MVDGLHCLSSPIFGGSPWTEPSQTATLLDTGHFTLETHLDEIVLANDEFLSW